MLDTSPKRNFKLKHKHRRITSTRYKNEYNPVYQFKNKSATRIICGRRVRFDFRGSNFPTRENRSNSCAVWTSFDFVKFSYRECSNGFSAPDTKLWHLWPESLTHCVIIHNWREYFSAHVMYTLAIEDRGWRMEGEPESTLFAMQSVTVLHVHFSRIHLPLSVTAAMTFTCNFSRWCVWVCAKWHGAYAVHAYCMHLVGVLCDCLVHTHSAHAFVQRFDVTYVAAPVAESVMILISATAAT